MATIIDGVYHAACVRAEIKRRLEKVTGMRPSLAVIAIGEDPASVIYADIKRKACGEVGIGFVLHTLSPAVTLDEILSLVNKLNADAAISGILVQRPLPLHICKNAVAEAVLPAKDVDCLHPINIGKIVQGVPVLLPCTPGGILDLLKRENIEIAGKYAVIVGRSDIVGKPLAAMLTNENATVTLCHSRTQGIAKICKQADILVVAVGQVGFITADFVKPGAVVVDVGINRNFETGEVVGDVDFEKVADIAGFVTPVPGGVGPMTVATLLGNCVQSFFML